MKVNSNNVNNISFDGFWGNKNIKNVLKFASNNGALFAATTTLALSAGIRPLVILSTPNTNNENKKIACAKSITSGLLEFVITLLISAPIAAAFKKIDKNPKKYLKTETINNLKKDCSNLKESNAYSLATQLFKLGIGFAVVIPKSILTALGIPVILDKCFSKDKNKNIENNNININFKQNPVENLSKIFGRILNNKSLQKFADKHKDSNFPLHIFALKDIATTLAFIKQANKTKDIKDNQKPFLIKNSIISTAMSIITGYTIDKLTEKPANRIIHKITFENKNDKNLAKYIEGFKIIKPILILATIYYTIIPLLSTFIADKISRPKD